ncbi:MAG: urease accessory protein UreF [Pseudomonadota bacterium]
MSTKSRSLQLLLGWLSPSFPVGAYAFSHGLEYAVEHGSVTTPKALQHWIRVLLTSGSAHADLVFARHAWRAESTSQIRELAALALAFSPSAEIKLESVAQGEAFARATADAWPSSAVDELAGLLPDTCPYPIAVARVARHHDVSETALLSGYAHAFCANLVSAAIRLVPLGQTDGQRVMAGLLDAIENAVDRAMQNEVNAIASHTLMSDIASMKHEHQYTRLFRS